MGRRKGYNSSIISTIVDMLFNILILNWGYNSSIISTIVDGYTGYTDFRAGYNSSIISTIVDVEGFDATLVGL